ncbi:MAG: hypothetical protein GY812_09755 [Actinomycetia bacterium]|nr:hypothetical protein [Actinomycetes bacterium]
MSKRTIRLLLAVLAALTLVASACSSDDDADSGEESSAGGDSESSCKVEETDDGLEALQVPQNCATIQEAVDAASEGDLVLVDEGTYKEAVDVTTADITIRGTDRNKVILDGGFELENGIRVLDTDGVVVENMTAHSYVSNGFFWTGSDYYRGSYLTAYRNGDYGIYSFDAYHGQLDNSLGWGSPDAGFYIGECFPCDAVIDNVDSQYNGLGYSGTNSGGDLYIINSSFSNNRAGIVPNSGSYELCYPERDSTLVGNLVHDNNLVDGPGISVSLLAQGNGILPAGGVRNLITKNLVYNHDRVGIALVPFPEEDANDLAPGKDTWDTPCNDVRDNEIPPIPDDQCVAVEGLLEGCVVIWNPYENTVTDNVVEASGAVDIAVSTVDLLGTGETTDTLGNCFSGNTFSTTAPNNLEALAPCEGEGSGGSWDDGALDLLGLLGNPAEAPPKDSYKTTPVPPEQDNMPDATTQAPEKFEGPTKPDIDSITVPEKPA